MHCTKLPLSNPTTLLRLATADGSVPIRPRKLGVDSFSWYEDAVGCNAWRRLANAVAIWCAVSRRRIGTRCSAYLYLHSVSGPFISGAGR